MSRRHVAFAELYSTKIRAKLRSLRDDEGLLDLRAELLTAALLLTEKSFSVEYETNNAHSQRWPDFTVTFKTHTQFNVEVRRIRSMELEDEDAGATVVKLMSVLCDKVGQMPPSFINLLWMHAEGDFAEADLVAATLTLRQLAERKDEAFFVQRKFKSATDFLKQYQQLSAIVIEQTDARTLWLNPLARHKVVPALVSAIGRIAKL
ncbi:MAG: hypothetical protein KC546_07560 [Anaerolineae bacterium]|nr:hypothetical protein [Anaerolineae bacterium]